MALSRINKSRIVALAHAYSAFRTWADHLNPQKTLEWGMRIQQLQFEMKITDPAEQVLSYAMLGRELHNIYLKTGRRVVLPSPVDDDDAGHVE